MRAPRSVGLAWVGRSAAALLMGLLALVPGVAWLSQGRLDDASYAFAQGDCRGAASAARRSISLLGNRADAYEILGYCDIRSGRPGAALAP